MEFSITSHRNVAFVMQNSINPEVFVTAGLDGRRRGSMAGGWVEFGHGGARWPATRLSFVTAAGLSFVTAGLDLGRRLV